ncbi:hypothetical protein THOM_1280 [Trachipleistophora hominis]|uniref:Uncharacterized protein n=1 Tax=Trachipleistophora hominis TaxID=72359 RepID=L7JYE4_TRAHO|nr:hypothetical protein THOM_1280 [Trachipleistophora hominis]
MLLTINYGKLIYEIEQKQLDAFHEKEKCPVDKRLRRQLRKIKKKLKKRYNKFQKHVQSIKN